MNTDSWLVGSVAAFDLLILALVHLYLRSHAVDRPSVFSVAAGSLGFAFHAFLFFSGALLVVQLATIAGVVGLCSLHSFGRQRPDDL